MPEKGYHLVDDILHHNDAPACDRAHRISSVRFAGAYLGMKKPAQHACPACEAVIQSERRDARGMRKIARKIARAYEMIGVNGGEGVDIKKSKIEGEEESAAISELQLEKKATELHPEEIIESGHVEGPEQKDMAMFFVEFSETYGLPQDIIRLILLELPASTLYSVLNINKYMYYTIRPNVVMQKAFMIDFLNRIISGYDRKKQLAEFLHRIHNIHYIYKRADIKDILIDFFNKRGDILDPALTKLHAEKIQLSDDAVKNQLVDFILKDYNKIDGAILRKIFAQANHRYYGLEIALLLQSPEWVIGMFATKEHLNPSAITRASENYKILSNAIGICTKFYQYSPMYYFTKLGKLIDWTSDMKIHIPGVLSVICDTVLKMEDKPLSDLAALNARKWITRMAELHANGSLTEPLKVEMSKELLMCGLGISYNRNKLEIEHPEKVNTPTWKNIVHVTVLIHRQYNTLKPTFVNQILFYSQ